MPLTLKKKSVDIPLDQIELSSQKWRTSTGDAGLEELANSLKEQGQIHNISLLPSIDDETKYEIANGHRRASAAEVGGLRTIRADLYEHEPVEGEDRDLAIARHLYAANMSEPLLPLERARMFEKIMEETDFTVSQVADLFENETADSVAEVLALLEIDDEALEVVENNPDRFTEANLRVLAEYSSNQKRGWRMQPEEQVRMAKEIVEQKDKEAVKDPRKFEKNIRGTVSQRRNREKAKRQENEKKQRKQPDPVKALFKVVEQADAAVNNLVTFDLTAIKEIDAADKGYLLNRAYTLVEQLSTFAEEGVAKVPTRKVGQAA